MEAQGFIRRHHELRWQQPDLWSDSLNSDSADLLGLSLGIELQTSLVRRQEDLKRIHPLSV